MERTRGKDKAPSPRNARSFQFQQLEMNVKDSDPICKGPKSVKNKHLNEAI
jgi:hypothetical protein